MNKNNISIIILGITLALVLTASSVSVSFGAFPGSPNFQLESGVAPEDIQCKENRVLLQRSNGDPACVSFHSGYKLLEAGWSANIPIHEQTSQKYVSTNSLEKAPAAITISQLLDWSDSLSFLSNESIQRSSTGEDDLRDTRIIPTYVPQHFELELYQKPSNYDHGEKSSTFWYVPNDLELENLEYQYELRQHGAIEINISVTNNPSGDFRTEIIDRWIDELGLGYYKEIAGRDSLVVSSGTGNDYKITVYSNDYTIFLWSNHTPLPELEKIIESIVDQI